MINALGGDDTINASTLVAGVVKLTIDGGAGDDMILGSRGADVLLGGDGDDFVDGQQGDDVAHLGAGDDQFQWDPGDGSDVVEGDDGFDTMLFNGANVSENIDISANGERVRFFRNVATITMDLNNVESITFKALGGADNIVVGDMSETDLREIGIDLAGAGDGNTGDGQVDNVTINGTAGDDMIDVQSLDESVAVTGLQADVSIDNAEADDRLVINGLGGNDTIDASALFAGKMTLTLNGGLGVDRLIGSAGDDLFNGGDGDDLALMGAGDDTFVWNPGDDNDTLEGQDGFDTMLFNGANVAENIDISANGERVLFTRNVANVTMDLNDVERIQFNALGGADNIVVNDLSDTDVTKIAIDLGVAGGGGDGQADTVTLHGTGGDDEIIVSGSATGVSVSGSLAATVTINNAEAANDRLVIEGGAGDDVITADGLPAGILGLTLSGGAGDDILMGGAGDDILEGGDGDDVLIGGGGNDLLVGGAGDNVEIQGFQAGADRIDLRNIAGDAAFDWVMAHAQQVDSDVVFDFGDAGQVKVTDVDAASLHAANFLL